MNDFHNTSLPHTKKRLICDAFLYFFFPIFLFLFFSFSFFLLIPHCGVVLMATESSIVGYMRVAPPPPCPNILVRLPGVWKNAHMCVNMCGEIHMQSSLIELSFPISRDKTKCMSLTNDVDSYVFHKTKPSYKVSLHHPLKRPRKTNSINHLHSPFPPSY